MLLLGFKWRQQKRRDAKVTRGLRHTKYVYADEKPHSSKKASVRVLLSKHPNKVSLKEARITEH